MSLLSINERAKDAVRIDHPNTDARQNNVSLILLALFVSGDQLSENFAMYNDDLFFFQELCLQIWEQLSKQLEKHALYITKSQIKSKLDQDLRRAAKAHAIKPDIIDKNTNNDEQGDDELGDEGDFRLSDMQCYANVVKLSRIWWKKANAIDCLNFSVLSYI